MRGALNRGPLKIPMNVLNVFPETPRLTRDGARGGRIGKLMGTMVHNSAFLYKYNEGFPLYNKGTSLYNQGFPYIIGTLFLLPYGAVAGCASPLGLRPPGAEESAQASSPPPNNSPPSSSKRNAFGQKESPTINLVLGIIKGRKNRHRRNGL